jgi:hypothetical protein
MDVSVPIMIKAKIVAFINLEKVLSFYIIIEVQVSKLLVIYSIHIQAELPIKT